MKVCYRRLCLSLSTVDIGNFSLNCGREVISSGEMLLALQMIHQTRIIPMDNFSRLELYRLTFILVAVSCF